MDINIHHIFLFCGLFQHGQRHFTKSESFTGLDKLHNFAELKLVGFYKISKKSKIYCTVLNNMLL